MTARFGWPLGRLGTGGYLLLVLQDPQGCKNCFSKVIRVFELDLIVGGASESEEMNPGAYMQVNNDDDDKDGVMDIDDGYNKDGSTTPNEDDENLLENDLVAVLSESTPSENKKVRGFPVWMYFISENNKSFITKEFDTELIFSFMQEFFSKKYIIREPFEEINSNPNIPSLKLNVDEQNNIQELYSFDVNTPSMFSDNYFQFFVGPEIINRQIEAGEKQQGLAKELEFFESAITENYINQDKDKIISMWCEDDKEWIIKYIDDLETKGVWPEEYVPQLISNSPYIYAILRDNNSAFIYFKAKRGNAVQVAGVRINNGEYCLFKPSNSLLLNNNNIKNFIVKLSKQPPELLDARSPETLNVNENDINEAVISPENSVENSNNKTYIITAIILCFIAVCVLLFLSFRKKS